MKCENCKNEVNNIHRILIQDNLCINCYYKKRDQNFPYIVRYGDDCKEFATKEEAHEFVDDLHSAYVERKN